MTLDITTVSDSTSIITEQKTTKPIITGDEVTHNTTKSIKVGQTKIRKAIKKQNSKKILLKLKKIKGAKKYQIQVSKNKRFKKVLVKKTVKKTNVKINSKKVIRKKKLYVRARAVKIVKSQKYYGKWSKAKKIKIKKK